MAQSQKVQVATLSLLNISIPKVMETDCTAKSLSSFYFLFGVLCEVLNLKCDFSEMAVFSSFEEA